MTFPLQSLSLTSPVTYSCVLSIAACNISRSGDHQNPLQINFAQRGIISSLRCASSLSSVIDSMALCALSIMVPPGVSQQPLAFIPTNLFSTISMRPIPCLLPYSFRVLKIVAGVIDFPLILTGSPCLYPIVIYSAVSGASSGEFVQSHISFSGSALGSSSTMPS